MSKRKTKDTDIWHDPRVKSALKEGRPPEDIAVLACPICHEWGYYNQGSHFTCLHCDRSFYCCSDDEDPPEDGRPYIYLDEFATLADTVQVDPDVP